MKLGSAHQGSTLVPRTIERPLMLPPCYRVHGRKESLCAPLSPGLFREVWLGEAPGGVRVTLTIYRATASGPVEPTWLQDLVAPCHPNMVPLFAAWPFQSGWVVVAAEPGSDLATLFPQEAGLRAPESSVPSAYELLDEAAKALDYLGSVPRFRGHGFVRPETIRTEAGCVVLERPLPAAWEAPPESCGAGFVFTAPDRLNAEAEIRLHRRAADDQFSLAACYVQIRTGRPPFRPVSFAEEAGERARNRRWSDADRVAVLAERPLDLSSLDASERSVLARALAADARERYPSCRAFVEALSAAARQNGGCVLGSDVASTRPRTDRASLPNQISTADVVAASPLAMIEERSRETGLADWLTAVGTPDRGGEAIPASPSAPRRSRPGRRVRGMVFPHPSGKPVSQAEPPSAEIAAVATATATDGPPGASDSGLGAGVVLVASSSAPRLTSRGSRGSRGHSRRRAALDARRSGDSLLAHNQPEEAVAAYSRALEIVPDDATARHGRALALFALRRLDEAMLDLDLTLTRRPRDASARNNRGLLRLAKGDTEGAIDDFRRAAEQSPGFALVQYNLGRAEALLGRLESALTHYGRALELDPGFAKAFRARAGAWARLGHAQNALADFDQAVRLVPDDPVARHQRGLIRFASADLGGAVEDFERAIRVQPTVATSWYDLGRVLFALGRHDEAIAAFDETLRLDPTFVRAERGRVEALSQRGATRVATPSVLIKPGYPEVAATTSTAPVTVARDT